MKNRILPLSATQGARDFSRLLDRVGMGAQAVIVRHSKPIALISPAPTAPRRLSECIAVPLAYGSATADKDFASDLKEIIQGHPAEESSGWE